MTVEVEGLVRQDHGLGGMICSKLKVQHCGLAALRKLLNGAQRVLKAIRQAAAGLLGCFQAGEAVP